MKNEIEIGINAPFDLDHFNENKSDDVIKSLKKIKSITCLYKSDLNNKDKFDIVLLDSKLEKNTVNKNNDIVKITPLNLGRAFEIGHAIFMRISDVYFSRKGIINEGKVALWNENLEPTLIEYLRTSLTEADLNTAIEKARTIFLGKH